MKATLFQYRLKDWIDTYWVFIRPDGTNVLANSWDTAVNVGCNIPDYDSRQDISILERVNAA